MSYAILLKKSDLVRETPRAWGFWEPETVHSSAGAFACGTEWLPKSQCTLEDHSPDHFRLIMPDWLGKKLAWVNTSFDGIDRI